MTWWNKNVVTFINIMFVLRVYVTGKCWARYKFESISNVNSKAIFLWNRVPSEMIKYEWIFSYHIFMLFLVPREKKIFDNVVQFSMNKNNVQMKHLHFSIVRLYHSMTFLSNTKCKQTSLLFSCSTKLLKWLIRYWF